MHEAAKEMVQLAEQGYTQREDSSDPAWQEMLNHATMKVSVSPDTTKLYSTSKTFFSIYISEGFILLLFQMPGPFTIPGQKVIFQLIYYTKS